MFTNKKLLFSGIAVSMLTIVLTEPVFFSLHGGIFNRYEASFFEPIFYWSLAVVAVSIIMLFFSSEVFKLWFSSIFRWFLPIALVLTFLSDPQSSFTFPDRAGVAALFGELLVLVTIIFALVQKFYYKR